jgi:hypothetical protein
LLAPRVEGGPGAEVIGNLPQPVLHLGTHREGAVNAVRTVGSCLVFATPNAHVTDETGQPPGRLRLEGLVDPGLPPGIRLDGADRGERGGNRSLDLRCLRRGQLDVHGPKS